MPIKLDHLDKLFHKQIKDAHSAESQLLEALPKMHKAASDVELKAAFADHLKVTKTHISRLQEIAERLEFSPLGHHCNAMEGLIKEGAEVIEASDADPSVRDAALICAAQKVEHYEVALYGCLRAYAEMLSHDSAQKLLAQTLEEERAADTHLTEIAMGTVNVAANS